MTGAKTAVEWLASAAPDPEACRWEWERNPLGVALLPAGKAWDVLILPGELGYPTLDVLTRILDQPGPVLVDFGDPVPASALEDAQTLQMLNIAEATSIRTRVALLHPDWSKDQIDTEAAQIATERGLGPVADPGSFTGT